MAAMACPAVYRHCSFENFDAATRDQRRLLKALPECLKGTDLGLFLCGPCGTGRLILALRARGVVGRFASVQELLVQCRDSFRHDKGLEDTLERVCRPRVLVLDDL
jgi:DNA replication protein DnaC